MSSLERSLPLNLLPIQLRIYFDKFYESYKSDLIEKACTGWLVAKPSLAWLHLFHELAQLVLTFNPSRLSSSISMKSCTDYSPYIRNLLIQTVVLGSRQLSQFTTNYLVNKHWLMTSDSCADEAEIFENVVQTKCSAIMDDANDVNLDDNDVVDEDIMKSPINVDDNTIECMELSFSQSWPMDCVSLNQLIGSSLGCLLSGSFYREIHSISTNLELFQINDQNKHAPVWIGQIKRCYCQTDLFKHFYSMQNSGFWNEQTVINNDNNVCIYVFICLCKGI